MDISVISISLSEVTIESPVTLVLGKVDQKYNGKYRFNAQVSVGGGDAEVDLFIAGKF
jgi:hypothetical protein